MKNFKFKLKNFIYNINFTYIQGGLILLLLFFLLFNEYSTTKDIDFTQYIDKALIFSIAILFLLNFLLKYLKNKFEDMLKVNQNTQWLNKKYNNDTLLEFNNKRFPIIEIVDNIEEHHILFEYNQQNHYKLPSFVAENYFSLMGAHDTSKIYNQFLLRVDDCIIESNGLVTIKTSRTSFYDSLVTNRVIDKIIENSLTIREMYEPGPILLPLNQSMLSNHLGFNLIVKTSDEKIILVKRDSSVSIGKNVLGVSVAASIKPKFFGEYDNNISLSAIEHAISEEFKNELGVDLISCTADFSLQNNTLSFFRELYEGGKPQFLFHLESNYSFKEHSELFATFKKNKDECRDIDGSKLVAISLAELNRNFYEPNINKNLSQISINNKKYILSPSHYASLALYLKKSQL